MDVVQQCKHLTDGAGVDLCYDAAGVQVAVDSGLKAVKAKGTFVNIALWGDKRVSLDMVTMIFGERHYMAGKHCCIEYPAIQISLSLLTSSQSQRTLMATSKRSSRPCIAAT
jgi:threonine dehydrogenase-like Zn-dependent dehydrogenase